MKMKNLLETLEREANRLVNIVDNQFQDTTMRVITGDVFTHDPSVHLQNCQEQPVTVQPALPTRPASDARKDQPMRQPTLQRALNKR